MQAVIQLEYTCLTLLMWAGAERLPEEVNVGDALISWPSGNLSIVIVTMHYDLFRNYETGFY